MTFSFRFLLISLLIICTLPHTELAAQNRRLVKADQAFELKQYNDALNLYRKAYNRVRRKDRQAGNRIVYQTAQCYRLLNDHRRAETYFRRAVRANYPDSMAIFYLAETLMFNQKFEEALTMYTRFGEKSPGDWRVQRGIESIALIDTIQNNPKDYEVELQRVFNSREHDFTTAFGDHRASTLVFASSRADAFGSGIDPWTGQKHTSLFISFQDRAGTWSKPVLLDEGPVNTEFNEGAPAVNASATRMYFTRCTRGADFDKGCRIFVSERQGANWGEPTEIPLVTDSTVTVGHPAISADELELFFVSDMPDGIGEHDIWVARRRAPSDDFGPPENLGPTINTPGSELFPFIRDDGTLFFASDGHPGLGGLDIFMSQRSPEGWSTPEHLGVPINSSADDFGIIFYPGREQGFFSSNRPGTRGYDLFSFYLAPLEFTIQGLIADETNKAAIQGAVIQLIGSDGSLSQVETDKEGKYMFGSDVVKINTNYDLLVSRERYFSTRGQTSTRGFIRSENLTVDFELAPIPDRAIPLPEILYEFASWELLPQFKDSLNGLVTTLKDNPNIVIELASHTDSRGTDIVNDTLSQRRAREVVNFLIGQGIEPERLEAVGYGKRVPRVLERDIISGGFTFPTTTILNENFINSLDTEEHRDAAHQLNRRTEFRVLRDDYRPPPPAEDAPPGN